VFAAAGGEGGPGWYEPETCDYEMPEAGMRVLIAHEMHWTLEYTDNTELRDKLEVLAVLSGWNAAQQSHVNGDEDDE